MEAAFFDLDKTIIARASMAAYVPALRRAGYLNAPMAARAAWGQLLFRFSVPTRTGWTRPDVRH